MTSPTERPGPMDGPARSPQGPDDRAIMARSLAYLFAAGGALAFVSLAVPAAGDVVTLRGLKPVEIFSALATALLTLFLFLYPRSLGLWAYQVLLAAGTVLITSAIYLSGETASAYVVLYVLVALYASYFFSRRQAIVQIAFIGLAYGALLLIQNPPGTPIARWLTILGTLMAAGAMVRMLRERLERLIGQLRDAARTDVLTGLLNRRGFEEMFELELERAERGRRPMSLVIGDIDHFKVLNDTKGHKAGDRALELVSSVLGEYKRKIDVAGRIGGEEFALLVPEADEHDAYILAERLRHKVAEAFADHDPPVTMSFGIASYPKQANTSEGLMIAGDQALYAAKELGRDRTVIHNSEIAAALVGAAKRRGAHREGYVATLLALAEALDVRDSGSSEHSQSVGRYAELTARELELPDEQVDRVRIAGLLHDIGSIGLPESVFKKPGPLGAEDWDEVKRHPEVGARMLESSTVEDISGWILYHHERPDGAGYPRGLTGPDIPLEAQIIAVSDAYEAMTSERPYRPALTHEEARDRLMEAAGSQFDARVVTALLRAVRRGGSRSPSSR